MANRSSEQRKCFCHRAFPTQDDVPMTWDGIEDAVLKERVLLLGYMYSSLMTECHDRGIFGDIEPYWKQGILLFEKQAEHLRNLNEEFGGNMGTEVNCELESL